MSKWNMSTLAEVGKFQAGVGFPQRLQGLTSGQYPFAKVGDISRVARAGKMELSTAENFVDRPTVIEMKVRPLPIGTIIFAKIGEAIRQNFKVTTLTECLIDNNVMGLIPNKDLVEPKYLFQFLRSIDIYGLAEKTTVPSIRKSTLEKVKIPLPPLEEQKRIAEILDRAESLRAMRRQSIEHLNTLTQAIFIEMFGDPKSNPKKWPIKNMADLFLTSPIFGSMIPPVPEKLGWLSIRVGNIQNWSLDLSDKKYIDLKSQSIERHSVKDGDLLLARAIASQDHLGKCIIAHPGEETWAFDSHIMRIRFDRNFTEPEFIRHLFMTEGGRSLFLSASRKSTVQFNINTKQIAALKIPVPVVTLQQEFAQRIEAIESLKAKHRESLAQLDILFASLQHRAFRGEL